jgi:DNA-binding NtrC family response regulator
MHILIVEQNRDLGLLWARHLEREGHSVDVVTSQADAISVLRHREAQVIVLDVVLSQGSALAVSDYASYRWPDARIVFVTNTTFFSDGSIFRHASNACAFLQTDTRPEDLAMMVSHYGSGASAGAG